MRYAILPLGLLALLLVLTLPARGADYAVAGIDDPALVANCLARLRQAVQAGDREAVAALVDYPIKAGLAGKRVSIKDKAAFLKHYDAIMTPEVQRAVLDQHPDQLFVNYQGVMLGNGQIWLGLSGQTVRVIAVNN